MINNLNTIKKGSALQGQKQTPGQQTQRNWRPCAILAIVGLMAALLTGCKAGKYTGGGFIQSVAGGKEKATFGFELAGIDATGSGQVTLESVEIAPGVYANWFLAKGQCTYNDHAAGVQFHYDCEEMTNYPAPDGSYPSGIHLTSNPAGNGGAAIFNGPYKSPAGNGTVYFTITCIDDDFSNTNNTITVSLSGGPYDGYYNSGTIQGGNIQFHPENTK
jgi:hypothetical protein